MGLTCQRCGGKGTVLSGDEARAMRVKKGLGLVETAKQMGIASGYLSDLEHDHRMWNPGLEARLKAALKRV